MKDNKGKEENKMKGATVELVKYTMQDERETLVA